MNVDILTNLDLHQMIKAHKQGQPLATLAVTGRKTSRYFLFDENQHLSGWRNVVTNETKLSRPDTDLVQKAFSGIHIIHPRIFSLLTHTGKFSMVDVYLQLAKENIINSFDHSDSKFIDVGKPESVLQAESLFS
jgi:NDP-sugar pyrophosphorylase family protein